MASLLLTIYCYPMKRSRFEKRFEDFARKAQESSKVARIERIEKLKKFFYPNRDISDDEQKNAQQHAEAVIAVLNEKYLTTLHSDFLSEFMTAYAQQPEAERIGRLLQHVVDTSYCITDSPDQRTVGIKNSIQLIENDSCIKYYIITGSTKRVKKVFPISWQEAIPQAFSAAQKYQNAQQEISLQPF